MFIVIEKLIAADGAIDVLAQRCRGAIKSVKGALRAIEAMNQMIEIVFRVSRSHDSSYDSTTVAYAEGEYSTNCRR